MLTLSQLDKLALRFPAKMSIRLVAPMIEKSPLACRIEAAIKASGMQHTDVAVAVGVSRPIITQWCQGVRAPRRENLLALAQVLGTSVAWLQEGHHIIRVDDPALADLLQRLQAAPQAVRDAVATLLPNPPPPPRTRGRISQKG